MLVFFVKQLFSLKRAILGRREPHQLAWGFALGVLLGLVPHGTLIALAILLFILSVRVNHGMVAITAVATTVVAAMLDPLSHAVGKYVLTHPDFAHQLSAAWQWPIMPWTDLNNTVVTGSLVIGLASLLPTYLLSYPLFAALAPRKDERPAEDADPPPAAGCSVSPAPTSTEFPTTELAPFSLVSPVDEQTTGESDTELYHRLTPAESHDQDVVPVCHLLDEARTTAIDAAFDDVTRAEQAARQVTVDTRIEVVRISEATIMDSAPRPDATTGSESEPQAALEPSPDERPVSEAMNYLLRQLRQSRQGRAA